MVSFWKSKKSNRLFSPPGDGGRFCQLLLEALLVGTTFAIAVGNRRTFSDQTATLGAALYSQFGQSSWENRLFLLSLAKSELFSIESPLLGPLPLNVRPLTNELKQVAPGRCSYVYISFMHQFCSLGRPYAWKQYTTQEHTMRTLSQDAYTNTKHTGP